MVKYAQLRDRVQSAETSLRLDLQVPDAASDAHLTLAHLPDYVRRVQLGELTEKEITRIGFPWSQAMVERSRRSTGATIAACRSALAEGLAVSLAGGTHHAFHDHGEGYCVFNDSAVAARVLRAEAGIERIAVIDADVHQGNGTAAILANDPSVFTFSIHGASNFPYRKERSDLDVDLADNTGDADYLQVFADALAAVFARVRPQLVIYLAGADPFVGDTLGRLALSKDGLADRDRLVLETCRQRDVPIAITMAGGYARPIEDTVDIHFRSVYLAAALCR